MPHPHTPPTHPTHIMQQFYGFEGNNLTPTLASSYCYAIQQCSDITLTEAYNVIDL